MFGICISTHILVSPSGFLADVKRGTTVDVPLRTKWLWVQVPLQSLSITSKLIDLFLLPLSFGYKREFLIFPGLHVVFKAQCRVSFRISFQCGVSRHVSIILIVIEYQWTVQAG